MERGLELVGDAGSKSSSGEFPGLSDKNREGDWVVEGGEVLEEELGELGGFAAAG